MFFIFSFVAWVFRGWAKQILSKVPVLDKCTQASETGDQIACYGTLAVFRITFCLAIFHFIMAAIMIGVKRQGDCRTGLQDGWWIIKILLIVGACVGAFFIPNVFFEYYGWFALAASAIFIIVQLLLLVDFAHTWAEHWIENMEGSDEGDNRWWWVLLITSIGLFSVSVAATIVMYVFFCHDAVLCGRNIAVITINTLLCLLVGFGSIHPRVQEANPRSGLLQASLITAYSTYLILSSMMSVSDSCNPWVHSTGASNISVLIGAVFTIIAVCYTTIRAASQVGNINLQENEPLVQAESGEKKKEEAGATTENPDELVAYNYSRFHAIFGLGALYIAMLMTDWRTVYNPGSEDIAQVDSGEAAVWVKVVSSWLCVGLYIWTLVGPVLFPDRDWS